jgi:hypothetical protein
MSGRRSAVKITDFPVIRLRASTAIEYSASDWVCSIVTTQS